MTIKSACANVLCCRPLLPPRQPDGYEGIACAECGYKVMVRSGTALRCTQCGSREELETVEGLLCYECARDYNATRDKRDHVTQALEGSSTTLDIKSAFRHVDIGIGIYKDETIENVMLGRSPGDRLCAFFVKLAALAKEDERVAALMGDYVIEVKHGDKWIWPVKGGNDNAR